MRARYYSVELMRFINEDIVLGDLGSSNSLNRYTYVEGNPATMIDPFGLCGVDCDLKDIYKSIEYQNISIGLMRGISRLITISYNNALIKYEEERARVPAPSMPENAAGMIDYTEKIDAWLSEKENELHSILYKSNAVKYSAAESMEPLVNYGVAAVWFYNQVKTFGPMDIKQAEAWESAFESERPDFFIYRGEIMDPGTLGNITYGYIGSELFSEDILYLGGGAVQVKRNDFKHIIFAPNLPYCGDAPEDHEAIKKGIEMRYEQE